MSTISSFKTIENNHDVYSSKDCMEKFCENHIKMQKSVIFVKKYLKDKKYCKVRDHCHYTGEYRGAAHSLCNLKYSVPKKIPIAFHNGSNYDYHFIIKELAEEFKKQLNCLGENTEKYITFTVPAEKEVTRTDKNEEVTKNTYYNLSTVQNLWQSHYQILSIIFMKEFIELNVNMNMIIKIVKHAELNKKRLQLFS